MSESIAEGGRRSPSALKKMKLHSFGPANLSWQVGDAVRTNAPVAVVEKYGEAGATALNVLCHVARCEPEITQTIRELTPAGWSNPGLENRMKSPASLARKIQQRMERDGITPVQAADRIQDALRFTVCAPSVDGFAPQVAAYLRSLTKRGYKIIAMEDSFLPGNSYMGFHSNAKGETVVFEIQFHTEDSLRVKQAVHGMYEDLRDIPGATVPQMREIVESMRAQYKCVEMPSGLDQIDVDGLRPTRKER